MMTFDTKKMSGDEWLFIRGYCAAVARDYDLLQIIRGLVAPNFRVKSICDAIKLGRQLLEMQNQVIADLYSAAVKHGSQPPPGDEKVPYELIAEVFTQSFFKIIDSDTKDVLVIDEKQARHDGWSSGHPEDWEAALSALKEIHAQKLKNKTTAESIIVSALFKLFSAFQAGHFSGSVWPPQNYAENEDWDEDYDDYYDSDYGSSN